MRSFRMTLWAAGLAAAGLTGCVDIQYVGQTFPALPSDAEVAFFTPEIPVPEGEYHAVGRATVTAPGSTNSDTLREDLIEAARDRGADAVQVVEFKRVKVGERASVDSASQGPNSSWNQDARNAGGDYIYTNSFGQTTELEKPARAVYETTVKALFLVTNARFRKMTKELRHEERAVAEQTQKALNAPVTSDSLNAAVEQLPSQASTPGGGTASQGTPPKKQPSTQVQLRNDPVTL